MCRAGLTQHIATEPHAGGSAQYTGAGNRRNLHAIPGRWQQAVTPSEALFSWAVFMSRAGKGLQTSTGAFANEVTREATRDDAPAIDLIDGEQLLDKLKELSLGVRTRKVEVEEITVDQEWLASV